MIKSFLENDKIIQEKKCWIKDAVGFYRILIHKKDNMGNDIGFDREFRVQSNENPAGMNLERAKSIAGKKGHIYKITRIKERII